MNYHKMNNYKKSPSFSYQETWKAIVFQIQNEL